MNEKEPMQSKKVSATLESATKLDSEFFEEFKEVGLVEAFAYLDGEKEYRQQQKEVFLSGEIENPELDYPEIDLEEFTRREEELRELKKKVRLSVDDSDEAAFINSREARIVRQAYLWRINESIATIGMLRAAAEGDMGRFEKYNRFIYGEPSQDIFDYTVNGVIDKAEEALRSADPEIVSAAEDLLEVLPDKPEEVKITEPIDREFDIAKQSTMSEFSDVLRLVPERSNFKAEDIKQVFSVVLEDMDIDSFEVVIDRGSGRTGLAVNQEKREVIVPESRELDEDKMRQLMVHEIGTHVKRGESGKRSNLMLMQVGLDRYEKGEEGVAKLREQTLAEEFDQYSGLTGQLAIGLAQGMDGDERDFRGVYEIMEKYFYLSNLLKDQDPENAKEKAKNSAYKRCVRTFRGSDCKTSGVCYTKDIAYREGQIGVWQVVADSPEEVRRFSIGRYDPANERHIWILDQLGITDGDLQELENQ